MERQRCTVSVAGLVEESSAEVTVDAGSLYEAAVRGLAALRQGPFSAEDAESAAVVTVTIRPAPLVHRVKVANLVALLASDEGSHITGEEIRIDGGALS